MNRAIVSPLARIDLADIWEYISDDNVDAAARVIRELYGQCEVIAQNPQMGRNREDEFGAGMRSFPFGHYVIFYSIEGDAVEIHRVLHGARDISSEFE